MASVAFGGEDESQPSTSNGNKYKLPKTFLDGCPAVNHASVPKKLRSAIKKRGRESITLPLPIPKKKHHTLNGVDTLRKDGTKKSKLNMREGRITKDEEEVAETLYALAGMFSDAKNADPPAADHEQPESKSLAALGRGSVNATEGEESRKMTSKITFGAAAQSSSMVDSTAQIVKSQSLGAQQLEFFSSKEPPVPGACGVQSDLNLGSRPPASILGMTQCGDREIDLEQVGPGVQYEKNSNPIDDKCKGTSRSPNLLATGTPSSETQRSSPGTQLSAWFDNTNISSQPHIIENIITTEKYTGVAIESKKSWKRCTAHVYISRLIKVLQISDIKEGLTPEPPIQLTPCGGAEKPPPNQTPVINGRNESAAQKDSSGIKNDILIRKRPVQDQQMASQTSALCSTEQGYDFLSLGTGVCGSDSGEGVNRAGPSHEPCKQYHMSYMQSQDHSAMLFSCPHNSYSSTFQSHNSASAAQQVLQLPQYHSSAVNNSYAARTGQQMEAHQQKWAAQLQNQYSTGGGGGPLFPDWKNGGRDSASVLNYAHALFPHLHAALGPKYQQFSPSHEQVMALNSSLPLSNMKRTQPHLPLGFDRNGAAFGSENIQQLQLPCNQHL